ncbi:MAG: hypothetical protein WCG87_02920 [Bacteroidota bacterium]
MKKLLLILFIVPMVAIAQKVELGLDGGCVLNSAPIGMNIATPSAFTPTVSLKALYKTDNGLQIGLCADMMQLSYNLPNINQPLPSYSNYSGVTHGSSKYYIARTAVPVKAFINKTIFVKSFELYGGISVGYVYSFNKLYATETQDAAGSPRNVRAGGMTMGAQVGGNYPITKRVSMNAEVSGNYLTMSNDFYAYKIYTCPITVGFRYKIGNLPKTSSCLKVKHSHYSRKAFRDDKN